MRLTFYCLALGCWGCICPCHFSKPALIPPNYSLYSSGYKNIHDPDGIFRQFEDTLAGRIRRVDINADAYKLKDPAASSDLNRTLEKLTDFQKQLDWIKNSATTYLLRYTRTMDPGKGATIYDADSNTVVLQFGLGSLIGQEVFAHEIMHAIQYEKGRMSFSAIHCDEDNLLGHITLYDLSDETEAYRYGILFQGNITDFDQIDNAYVLKRFPQYDTIPDKEASICSTLGRILRRRMVQMGKTDKAPGEIYRGWESDYGKGRKTKFTFAPSHAIIPTPISIADSSILKVGVCTPDVIPFSTFITPSR